ncbi:nitrate- and nitrite sensing domain-containing protein [Litoribacter populi]|uniref:nitrate- and nitrite sensing domain-containing protein n=1 Tax=Litoribacter populi TaxID=2598460 RepID=UPI0011801892|nr:nitrate- and nitrite sensing domain-containing protein [Litoribacter populi]
MNILNNLSIRYKLLLLSLTPVAALLYFIATALQQDFHDRNQLKEVQLDVERTASLSKVVHALQQERAISEDFVLGGNIGSETKLLDYKEKADAALQEFYRISATDSAVKKRLNALLPGMREKVQSRTGNPDSLQADYGNLLLYLIDDVNRVFNNSQNPEVKRLLSAHVNLMYGKEFFGQLRSELNQNILRGGFNRSEYAQFAALKGKAENNLEQFAKSTTEPLAAAYMAENNTPNTRHTRAVIRQALDNPGLDEFTFSQEDWWVTAGSLLNTLKTLEDQSVQVIQETSAANIAKINATITQTILIGGSILLLLALLLYHIIRGMVNTVGKIKQVADKVALGDLDEHVTQYSKDEFGSLAQSFNRLIRISRQYASNAEAIGMGDYSKEIEVRSEEDTLGQALSQMRDNLQRLSDENRDRTWLLTGNSDLNDTIRGEKELQELAQEIIRFISNYLNAQIGAVYLAENGGLKLYGNYAFQKRGGNKNFIEFGEGLVGQAALEQNPIIYNDIPANYIKVSSALGDARPNNIIVYPFFYEGELKGVLEIASTRPFSDLEFKLLDLVGENIGIAFHSNQSRSQMKELLEESQRQAEELEARQEELRQTNEELHAKTGLLEESELELKAQQEELQQTNEELEEKANLLEEQKAQLETAKVDVEKKARQLEITSKYKSEFLANMSHELRTPLNSVLILAELLGENKSKKLGEKEVEFAKNIHASGNDLLSLINEILDLSKVESGKIELDYEEILVKDILGRIQSAFKEVALKKGQDFHIRYEDKDIELPILTDKLRLEQVLRNLLSNAFKFTPEKGKVDLHISLMPSRGQFKSERLNRTEMVLAFVVKDTGIGIPVNKQGVVFEAFQQADGSTKRKYGGTGLGLSISREIASALGGEIMLESEEGHGSTFTLYLPIEVSLEETIPYEHTEEIGKVLTETLEDNYETAPVLDNLPFADDRESIKSHHKVILIIEDDEKFANILLRFVREKGYTGHDAAWTRWDRSSQETKKRHNPSPYSCADYLRT